MSNAIPWNITYTESKKTVELLSTFDSKERSVVLKGTGFKDVFNLFLAGKYIGLVVGSTPEFLDECVRKKLGRECFL